MSLGHLLLSRHPSHTDMLFTDISTRFLVEMFPEAHRMGTSQSSLSADPRPGVGRENEDPKSQPHLADPRAVVRGENDPAVDAARGGLQRHLCHASGVSQ